MKKRKKGVGAKRETRDTGARSAARARRSKRAHGRAATGVFALASECTISDIAPLQAGLTNLLEHPSPVTLDLEAVQRIDTVAMQMVAAFVRERESQGRQVEWRGSAPVFGSAARLLGLAHMLHLPDSP